MKIDISNGELLDRISILELKLLNVKDTDKLANVERQFASLNPLCVELFENNDSELQSLYLDLAKINGILWGLENLVRNDTKTEDLVQYAARIFKQNEERNKLINDINLLTGSDWLDIKNNMKKGVIAGNFDVMHPGYIKMFKECKTYCKQFVRCYILTHQLKDLIN